MRNFLFYEAGGFSFFEKSHSNINMGIRVIIIMVYMK